MMKTAKRLMIILLASTLFFSISIPVFANELNIESRINSLELTPQPRPDWEATLNWYDFSRVDRINNNRSLSNYEKMRAVFIDVAQQTRGFNCTSHASVLGAAFEMLGFKVYGVSGGVRTASGKSPSWSNQMGFVKEGYTFHSWIAVEIDGVSKNPSSIKKGNDARNIGKYPH